MEAKEFSTDQIVGYGIDEKMDRRPGVPMESQPQPLLGPRTPVLEQQKTNVRILKRAGLAQLPLVFGTAQPPRGLSGILRRFAYQIPEHRASHWALLQFSDRIDVVEGVLLDVVGRRSFLALGIGAGLASWIGRRRKRNPSFFPAA